ncbi:MAG TPA: Calx-beta domain-containing protein [Pyrinomonadaceae bacterium]|nr:Calx-beta domain-containing protein [Pyrinomonadaceae bacterium]
MKNNRRYSRTHTLLFILFCVALAVLVSVATLFRTRAANPTSGTIAPAGPVAPFTGSWAGTGSGAPPTGGGEDSCTEGTNCDTFKLTISGVPADWVNKKVHVQINWGLPSNDYDMYVHKGSPTGPIVATSGSGGTTQEQVDLNPLCASNIGTGDFYVHVVYFAATMADQYSGSVSVTPATACAGPAPQGSGVAPRYENYNPPAAGPNTLGRSSGEPSIGVGLGIAGHAEGRAMFQSDVQTLRVTFNGSCGTPAALWENKPAPTSQQDFDPILFTDHQTGRTFASLLDFAANPVVGQMSYSDTTAPDNDGDVWHPSQGTGAGSGIDHQTVGGGPFAPPLNIRPPGAYPNAVYYCSQALLDASCARSDNGGASFGPSVIVYQEATATSCGGLHGHIKVAPDGTVYLPNKNCGGEQGVVVSTDNGLTWTIRHVPNSAAGGSDPSVGIGSGGRVYFGYADGDTKPVIAVSNDKGVTWSQSLDVGASLGINNVVFPAMVAGDNDRAAFAFLGTPTAGGLQGPKFTGIWHLYISHTYDGGASWITVDATPNDPVQRGCIWLGGGANICRNLLDFMDVAIDQQGRVLVGYADGCAGGECVQAPTARTGNSYTALAAIARQSGGRRLLSAFDPPNTATVPGTPSVTAQRNGVVAHLSWSEADVGTSPITGYQIYRGTSSGGESLLTSVGPTQLTFDDSGATNTSVTYFYRVTALNAQGESCGNNEVAARFVGDSCDGFATSADPTGDQTGAPGNADLDIQSLKISEPGTGPNAGKIVFNLKVADLSVVPAQRMWRVVWNSPSSPFGQYYVGMTKDQNNVVTFDYGTVETQVVGLVLGVPTTHRLGAPDAATFDASGLITVVVSRDKVGNPQAGDLLGGFSTRTYSTVTDQIRSTNAIDTTTNANANDNTANAQAYLMVGPVSSCAQGPAPTPTPSASPTPTPASTFQFDSGAYAVQEAVTSISVRVLRTGPTTARATVDVGSNDDTAKQRGDYEKVVGRLVFEAGDTEKTFTVLINEDSYTEGPEAATLVLQNPTNAGLGTPSTATLFITDDGTEPSTNVIDDSRTFVGTHYHDFLNRQADQSGEDFWTNQIEQCGSDAQCRQVKRINVSQAFFLSIEFKETGYLVLRAHKSGFGSGKSIPRYPTFLRDQRQITNGVIVGQGNWQQQLDANKQAYLTDFVSRTEFTSQSEFAQGAPAATYVDKLFSNNGVEPTSAERNAAISAYGSGDTAGRAAALKSVIESGSVFNAQYNPAFVLMQYYGYLRRNPDDAPDNNFSGYDFWLAKLNSVSQPGEDMRNDAQANARVQRAEMVRAFIESTEYRQRFFGSSTGNQFATPDEGTLTRFIKGVVRFTLFGDAV